MSEAVSPGVSSRMRILIVDDSSLVRLYYRKVLEEAGFEVEQAINGVEGMEKALTQPFDLVIADVNMPRMDGFSFVRSLRRSAAEAATLPVLRDHDRSRKSRCRRSQVGGREFLPGQAGVRGRSVAPRHGAHGETPVNPLHEQFITEARELIQQATDDLMALDREGFAPERIERVFRAFHTLKGSAGIVELPAMGMMLHAAEDLLAEIQAGRLDIDTNVIDQALACLDQVSQWVDDFESRAALPPRAVDDARTMAERLRALLPEHAREPGTAPAGGPAPSALDDAMPDWVLGLIESQRARISRALQERPALAWAISYEPHPGCFFNGDDPIQLMAVDPRTAWRSRLNHAMLGHRSPTSIHLPAISACAALRRESAAEF